MKITRPGYYLVGDGGKVSYMIHVFNITGLDTKKVKDLRWRFVAEPGIKSAPSCWETVVPMSLKAMGI